MASFPKYATPNVGARHQQIIGSDGVCNYRRAPARRQMQSMRSPGGDGCDRGAEELGPETGFLCQISVMLPRLSQKPGFLFVR
ncbi:MAG: hypothetical protein GDA56_32855 [Hormoscilla sp. GM7CHS1pb]|nr:hypothetical protein [Hormoscilla sp. GM7CHS1pb]